MMTLITVYIMVFTLSYFRELSIVCSSSPYCPGSYTILASVVRNIKVGFTMEDIIVTFISGAVFA